MDIPRKNNSSLKTKTESKVVESESKDSTKEVGISGKRAKKIEVEPYSDDQKLISQIKKTRIDERIIYSMIDKEDISKEESLLVDEIKNIAQFDSFPSDQLWRLFIDGIDHPVKGKFGFEIKEPGYLSGCYRGFRYGIKLIKTRKKVDAQVLVEIHDRATNGVHEYHSLEKKYITHEKGFRDHEPTYDPSIWCLSELGNFSHDGAKELIMESDKIDELYGKSLYKHKLYQYQAMVGDDVIYLRFGLLSGKEKIEKIINDILETCYKALENTDTTTQEKESSISECIKHIQRIHPFQDGNCRTITTILTNLMRLQIGLFPTIWNNPNITDACSCSEITTAQQAGAKLFLSYSEDRT